MSEDDGHVWIPTYSVGSYGGLDDRKKLKRRKQPLGFAPSKPKPKPKKKSK